MRHFRHYFLAVLVLFSHWTLAQATSETIALNPQLVVDKVLEKSQFIQELKLRYSESDRTQALSKASLEPKLSAKSGYQISKLQNLQSSSASKEDRNITYSSSLSKKYTSGTELGLSYERNHQKSTLNPAFVAVRPEEQTMDSLNLNFKQPLWNNSLGKVDRLNIEAADHQSKVLRLTLNEQVEELAVRAVKAFWAAYVAKELLRGDLAARDKYQSLVNNLRKRRNMGLAENSDLFRVQAEFQTQDSVVKSSSAQFLDRLSELSQLMQEPLTEDIRFELPHNPPPPPAAPSQAVENLRHIQIAKLNWEVSSQQKDINNSSNKPALDLIAQYGVNGVEKTSSASFSEMFRANHPFYFVGLQFQTNLFSEKAKIDRIYWTEQNMRNEIVYQRSVSEQKLNLEALQRRLSSLYFVYEAANKNLDFRLQVIKEEERNYQLGRLTLIQLIQDYNILFRSETSRIRALGDYYIALHEWAAAQDLLFPEKN